VKIVNVKLSEDIKKLYIIPISDVHLGDKHLNMKLLKETLKRIKEEENTYTILNGDFCNFALKNSKSDVYEDDLSPMEQLNLMLDLIEPIKDKILVISTGNHEDRIKKETNMDVTSLVAKQLGIEDRYADGWWYLYLRFGKKVVGAYKPMCYQITGYHGSGGGRKPGGKANRLQEMSQVVIADIYIMGHTHSPMSMKQQIYLPDYANNTLNKKEMHYIISNSFLEPGGYAEKLGMLPVSNTITEIELDGTKREIKTRL